MAHRDSLEDDVVESSMRNRGEEILRCPKCRKVILDDVPSCPACGTQFGRLKPASRRRWLVITAAILLVSMIFAWVVAPLLNLWN